MKERPGSLDLSIVVPVRNEAANVPVLVDRILTVMDDHGWSAEILFVTDINDDDTVPTIRDQHVRDPRVKMIRITDSLGQHVAVMVGLRASRGEAVVVMDGDLQDLPEDIPALHEELGRGYDVVFARKEQKNESSLRNLFSAAFLGLINRLSDRPLIHNTSMFRVMSRRVVDGLCRFDEQDPVITGLVGLMAFPTSTVRAKSGTRLEGKTNYSLGRQIHLAVDFLLAFSTKPLRMISLLGLTVSGLSFLYLLVVVAQALMGRVEVAGWPTLVSLMTLLGGLQLLALGVIGEYIGRIFIETKKRPPYFIQDQVGDLP
jgi:glycosyltransferase involved in cell wall biosynthesis